MEGGQKNIEEAARHLRENIEKTSTEDELKKVIGGAVAEMTAAENIVCLSEGAELRKWRKEKKKWLKSWRTFSLGIRPLIAALQSEISSLRDDELKQGPAEVRERLQNRKEGLEIIWRMLERLPQSQSQVGVNESMDTPHLERVKLPLKKLGRFAVLTNRQEILSEIENLLGEIQSAESKVRDANYELVRETRLDADRLKRTVTGFFKDYLLPASDGLEQGIWDEGRLREPLAPYENEQDLTERWFRAYHTCDRLLKEFMRKVGLAQVRAAQGMEFDPEWHTALGTEANSAFQDGQILELLRSGWCLFKSTIRPAEVLVVRNGEGDRNGSKREEK